MEKDTREELKRLEMELLGEDPDLDDEIVEEEPEDLIPDDFDQEEDWEYDDEPQDTSDEESDFCKQKQRRDRVSLGLMIAICFFSLGIIGVLIYWLENYL